MNQFCELLNEYKFSEKSTTTQEKLDVIQWENSLIKSVAPSRGPDEEIVGLVGNPEGLDRHITQWKQLGFRVRNMRVIEKNKALAQALYDKALKLSLYFPNLKRLANQIHHNDLFKYLQLYGDKVTHVDFDGISYINTLLPTLEEIASSCPNIRTAVIVVTTRSSAPLERSLSPEAQHLQKDTEYFANILAYNAAQPRAAAFRRIVHLLDKQQDLYEEVISDILEKHGDVLDLKYNAYKPRMISIVASFDAKLPGENQTREISPNEINMFSYYLNLIKQFIHPRDRKRYYEYLVNLYEYGSLLKYPSDNDYQILNILYKKIQSF